MALALLFSAACVDFDAARALCDAPGRRCASGGPPTDGGSDAGPDAGADAGPDARSDAGLDARSDAGPGAGSDAGSDAGPSAGSDAGSDAGWCGGCVAGSTCVAVPFNDTDRTCGTGGGQCVDCSLDNRTCRAFGCVTQRTWKQKFRAYNRGALRAVWVGDGGELWAAGDDSTLIHGAGGVFDEHGIGGNVVYGLAPTLSAGRPALVAVGTNGIYGVAHVLPLPWTDQGSVPGFSHTLFSEARVMYSASTAGDRLLIAGGRASGHVPAVRRLEADGGWSDVTPDAGWGMVLGAWGAPSGEYYAITDNPLLARVSGAGSVDAWPLPALPLGIWGGTPGSVWVAGSSGYVARFADGNFIRYDAGVEFLWVAAWASDDRQVFLVGENALSAGAIAEWDGVVWRTVEPTLAATAFTAVNGRSREDVWAVDLSGALWHFEP